jgi:hypothetical protein
VRQYQTGSVSKIWLECDISQSKYVLYQFVHLQITL